MLEVMVPSNPEGSDIEHIVLCAAFIHMFK